jgi:hypothetical protein
VAEAIVGKTADDGLNSSLKTLTARVQTASEAFKTLFGGGEQTGPLGSAKKKVDRLESEAERNEMQADRFRAYAAQGQRDGIMPTFEANMRSAGEADARALALRAEAAAIVGSLVPSGVSPSAPRDPGPSGAGGGDRGEGAGGGLGGQVQALVSAINPLVAEIAAIRAKLIVV